MPKLRGFASLTPEQHRQIASKGGKAKHRRGFHDADLARAAGSKGGSAPRHIKPYGYASRETSASRND